MSSLTCLTPADGSDLRGQVEALHQQAMAAGEEFCIELDGEAPDVQPVWQWAAYARKDNATRAVENSGLVEGVDYLLRRSAEQVQSANGVIQTRERVRILFSRDGFKQWLMLARTDRGRQVRLYFIDIEKRYQRELGQMTPLEATVQKLGEYVMHGMHQQGQRIASVENKVESLSTRFDEFVKTQSSQVVYVFANIRDGVVKIGFTEDLERRTKEHASANLAFMGAIPAGRQRERHILRVLKEKSHRLIAGDEYFALTYELVKDLQQLGLNIGMLADYNKAKGSISRRVSDGGTLSLFGL